MCVHAYVHAHVHAYVRYTYTRTRLRAHARKLTFVHDAPRRAACTCLSYECVHVHAEQMQLRDPALRTML
jgi:hypothetical protein